MARKATRAAQGSGTIRQRPDGRWEARYTVGRDPGTGKQIQRSVYGATQKEVRQKLQRAAVELDEGTYTPPSQLTVKQWLEIWLNEYNKDIKPSSLALYRQYVRLHIAPALASIKLAKLSPHLIQSTYNKMLDDGASPATVRYIHRVLHKALEQASAIGYIKNNPADSCKLPRVEKAEISPLTDEETRAFLSASKGSPYACFFHVALLTGMRLGELMGLPWDNVDFEAQTILVDRQLMPSNSEVKGFHIGPPKGDKSRLISPPPDVFSLLQAHRRKQLQQKLMVGQYWKGNEFGDLVFRNDFGDYFRNTTIRAAFRRYSPNHRFHDLRHTAAVNALRAGLNPKAVSDFLGHTSVSFTLDTYCCFAQDMQKDGASLIQKFYQNL